MQFCGFDLVMYGPDKKLAGTYLWVFRTFLWIKAQSESSRLSLKSYFINSYQTSLKLLTVNNTFTESLTLLASM
jgi:hypothetical protein